MDPYFILGIPETAGDEEIRRRYEELVLRFSPEKDAARFAMIRRAYESVRDLRSRVKTKLFRFDVTGRSLMEDVDLVPETGNRRRLSFEELASLFREGK